MEKIELTKIKKSDLGKAIQKLYELTENFDETTDAESWIHACGHCTGCAASNSQYDEWMRRIGENFAFVSNTCYRIQLRHREDEYPMQIAFEDYQGQWKITEKLKPRKVLELIQKAFAEAKDYAAKESEKNRETLAFLEKIL